MLAYFKEYRGLELNGKIPLQDSTYFWRGGLMAPRLPRNPNWPSFISSEPGISPAHIG